MLKDINSSYFFSIIFSCIDEKRKLKLIKYNKSLKDKTGIGLIQYKLLSERYIIYETKGKGKEYDWKDNLLFEGEFINGVKNGKGKEYYFDENSPDDNDTYSNENSEGINESILKFEGEYLNGKRNGKGKEYDEYGEIIFEGEFLNGEKYGKVKEYRYNELIFEGEYLNGRKNGKGREYYDGELKYEGEYLNGNRWIYEENDENNNNSEINYRKGKEYSEYNQLVYEGEYLNRKWNGKGKEYEYGRLIFEGEYLNGKRWNIKIHDKENSDIIYELKNGQGYIKEYDWKGFLKYEGEYLNGERNGKGKEYEVDKLLFEGFYLNGKRWNGIMREYVYDKVFECQIINGEINGKGKIFNFGYLLFEGEFYNRKRNGKGKEYNYEKELLFEGEFYNDYRIRGKRYIKGKLEYEGEYLFNKKWNGKGYDEKGKVIYELKNGTGKVKEYNVNNLLIYEGEYLNGKKNGKVKEYYNDDNLKKSDERIQNYLIFEGEYINGKKVSK